MFSFKRSAPSRTINRQTFWISSGPSATHAKVGVWMCGKCRTFSSPSPPVTVISGPFARYRGPGIRPASISSRITTPSRGFAEAPDSTLV